MELTARTDRINQMNVERLFARGFLVIGGVFWGAMWLASFFGAARIPASYSPGDWLAPVALLVIVITFVLGLFYEYVAAAVLFVGAFFVAVYGVFAGQWQEVGVWVIMAVFFMAPMVIAGILYLLAARTQATLSTDSGSAAK